MFEGLRVKHWKWNTSDSGVLHLIMDVDGASTNTFSRAVMGELGRLLERLRIEPPPGVVISSGKDKGFVAGADITEFAQVAAEGKEYDTIRAGQKVFDALERLSCPTVAAIHGFCMGGGTEMALACDYRVATDDDSTRIGLPEILLGIHPGWGGTVRLPRLIGPTDAMDMILTGRGLRAKVARNKGLVDKVVPPDQLLSAAEALVQRRPAPHKPRLVQRLANSFAGRQILAPVIRKQVRRKANPKHYPAPYAVIELWRRHGGNPAKMMVAEARSMVKVARTDTARNLTRVFFLRENMRALGSADQSGIEHVHVIGAGVMGGDIAAWCALRGLTVTLQDREAKYVQPALDRAAKLFKKRLKVPERIDQANGRLSMDIEGTGVEKADLVLEAIFENLEAKQQLFRDLEPRMKDSAIVATNTSSIPLQDLRTALKRPERLVGLHFFNPVAQMPLLEIVRHDQLDEETFTRSAGWSKQIDKLPVPVTSSPGFLVNRILMPYMMEAMIIHSEGVPGKVIDKAAKDFGMPMGPIELADVVGLDVAASVAKVLSEHLGMEIPDGLDAMIEGGKRGKKDGAGFYEWNEEGKPVKPEIPEDYQAPADLTDRMIMPYLNVAVTCLREGVVDSSDMLDAGCIFGTGFAPFRGGPYQYIVDTGTDELKAKLETLADKYGDRFKPDAGWDDL
ncbi:MAG: 3-hydroxyacyl-CoA dehydrogenase NAD-binding domain-containing protein [Xanthomonadales bacterium]|nr:3-hydroxyacyl-CoA dehydrogenase NAD-binding domain-containing protein [Xanthomonadales bacterium]